MVFLVVGGVISSGIFIVPYIAAKDVGLGATSLIFWVAMAAVSVAMSLVFAELISMYPNAGGVYTYIKKSFGEAPAFVIGWLTWVANWVLIAMLISAGLDYISPVINFGKATYIVVGIAVLFFTTLPNLRAVKYSGRNQLILTGATVAMLAALVFTGISKVDVTNYSIVNLAKFSPLLLLAGAAYIFEPFAGWESASFLAEEAKSVRKLSKALIIGNIIVISLYLGVIFVLFGVINWQDFTNIPLMQLSERIFSGYGGVVFAILALGTMVGCVNVWVVALARLPYSMARDRLLPSTFAKVNKHGVPQNALIFQFVCASAIFIALFGHFKAILEVIIPLTLVMYLAILAAYVVIRRKKVAPFNTHLARFVPFIIIPFMVALLVSLNYRVSYIVLIVLAFVISIPFYIQIKLQKDLEFRRAFFERLHGAVRAFYKFKSKKSILIDKLEVQPSDYVLDYGCGTGERAFELAKLASKGKVVAVDIVHGKLETLSHTVKDNLTANPRITLIEERKTLNLPSEIFDKILCSSALNYTNNPSKILKNLCKALRLGGKISLALEDSWVKPAPIALSNTENVTRIMKSSGFKNITVEAKGSAAKHYLITAEK